MKKNSSRIVIGVLLILVGISVYIYKSKSGLTTVDDDARNFSYKDTSSITRIFLADKDGSKADIKREKHGWVVNNKYNCRNEAILNLLEVIKLIDVKMPVPKTSRETVLKYMAAQAVKVEIYTADGLVKQYYVGHETADGEGSYMLLTDPETGKNHKDPYVCFIPGFKGYLFPRYITKENDWRDRLVVNYIPPQMKQINVQFFDFAADSSITIDLENANSFKMKTGSGAPLNFDEAKLRQYLVYFQNVSYEVLLTGKNKKLQDSLLQVKPFASISVTTTDSKSDKYNFYRKQFMGDVNPEHGVKFDHDPDRLYMSFGNDKEWALVQYFVFGKLLQPSTYFVAETSVKK